jgi:hypothetical protein
MEPPDFPPNSDVSRRVESKGLERITTSDATRKRKSLRRQFSEVFVAGDVKTATHYVIFDVVLPAAKDLLVDAISSGFEKLIFGEGRRRYRGMTTPQSGPYGHINYSRYSMASPETRMTSAERVLSRQARARHDFDEIILDSRTEAEEVIDRLFDLVGSYGSATVADLYELVGLASTHIDHKWGWTDLQGAGVDRIRHGYLLDLPEPEPL